MRYVLACLVCLVLVLAGCQVAPVAPADTGTSTEELAPTEEVTVTEEATEEPTEEAVPTEEVTSTEAVTETEGITETKGMTPTEGLTPTEEITSTEEVTAAAISVPFEVIQIIQEYAPGSWSPPHSHGGPGIAMVIEGQVTRRLGAAGEEEAVFGPGEFFYEYEGEIFSAGNAGQEQVRMAVLFLLPQGATLTTPVEGAAMADMPPGPTVLSRTSMTVTESLGNFEADLSIIDFAPGAWTPPHSHGGLVLVTILEGEVTERDEVTGEETVYGPGEFWTEEAGALHAAGNDGQENARIAVVILLPEGANMTMVEDGTATEDLPPGPTAVSTTRMSVTTAAE